jgi:hypothetical protein
VVIWKGEPIADSVLPSDRGTPGHDARRTAVLAHLEGAIAVVVWWLSPRRMTMPRFALDGYRKQWPRAGAVVGMAIGGVTALAAPKMRKTQVLAATNLLALIVHQYEELQDPGYGPGQMNRVMGRLTPIMRSENPRNYPLNTHSAMCINTAIAYPVYVAPILFPKSKTLGMMPVFFGMSQAALHGIMPKLALGDWYGLGSSPQRCCTYPSEPPT